ncbi:MAG: SDR family oxidoreductase [Rubrivivax sp.]
MTRTIFLGGRGGLHDALSNLLEDQGDQIVSYGRYEARAERGLRVEIPLDLVDAAAVERAEIEPADRLVWIAGAFVKQAHDRLPSDVIDGMLDLHLRGPMQFLRRFLATGPGRPVQLVCAGSVSSWKAREDEALYCAMKAAQATFTRGLAREIVRDRPGSRTLIVHPGGMHVPNFFGDFVPSGRLLDPAAVARFVVEEMQQQSPFSEIQVMRRETPDGGVEMNIVRAPQTPERPL